ncbi:alginate O-acetyltransferase AlgX-related protein [Burkholderia gladioli]|uniref:alginate O-acetyltransferase AlgX-related protein n=1 Tax=Burkholderia gladioli TaxID=28095 RepID=UPI00163E8EA5|nr:alginate O-acetyltransferase [Burkholderia gladioli]
MSTQHSDPQAASNRPGSSLARGLNRAAVAIVFFAILALPILWFGRPGFVPAAQENRRLEPFPRYSLFWFQNFERWFSDRYGMRDALLYYGSRLQMARTGTPSNPNVVIGRDGWLFYDEYYTPGQPHFASLYGKAPFSASDLRTISGNLDAVRTHLAACGIGFYVVLAPDKQSVYADKLQSPPPAGTVTQADQFATELGRAAPKLAFIDLRAPLEAARSSEQYDLYKRTDSHWNTLGAFIGYQAIASRLVRDGVLAAAPRAERQTYAISRTRFEGGDIAVNLLDLPGYFLDYIVSLTPRVPRRAHGVTVPGWPTDPVDAHNVIENPGATGSLLLYRDSFAGELIPFLGEDVHRLYTQRGTRVDGALVRRAQPRAVVLEIVERSLPHLLDAPVNLDQACRP